MKTLLKIVFSLVIFNLTTSYANGQTNIEHSTKNQFVFQVKQISKNDFMQIKKKNKNFVYNQHGKTLNTAQMKRMLGNRVEIGVEKIEATALSHSKHLIQT